MKQNTTEGQKAGGEDAPSDFTSPIDRDLVQGELEFLQKHEGRKQDSELPSELSRQVSDTMAKLSLESKSGVNFAEKSGASDQVPVMPVRRLHNFVYCKRLFFFQWVENLWEDNADTVAGSAIHKNVDRPSHWKDEVQLGERARIRSLELESEKLKLRGVIDLIEDEGEGPVILDYKKGDADRDEHGERRAKPSDRIQVGAYALLLREVEGIQVAGAEIYYASDRRRVPVEINDGLFHEVLELLGQARKVASTCRVPDPLIDDPRCLFCSAYPICLPNESATWKGEKKGAQPKKPPRPQGDEGEILVIQEPQVRVGKRAGEIVVKEGKSKIISKHPVEQLHSIFLYGAPQISTQAVHTCLERGINISYFSPAGRFLGNTSSPRPSGVDARRGQYRLFEEEGLRLKLTREIIRGKISNQRVLLMRNGSDVPKSVLKKLKHLAELAVSSDSIDSVRGYEGAAAAMYFQHFSKMLKSAHGTGSLANFDFEGRNRRPPRDPVNALLSLGYSMLAKELAGVCESVGLDSWLGFFHQPRFGRPALALDLMEEFRPLIADSVAISLINRGELGVSDFAVTSRGTYLKPEGRKQFWSAWFRRMDTEVTHPEFGYRLSYRRMLEVQARQLWRFVRGEAENYRAITTR